MSDPEYGFLLNIPGAIVSLVGDDQGNVTVMPNARAWWHPFTLRVIRSLQSVNNRVRVVGPTFNFTTEELLAGDIPKAFTMDVEVVEMRRWRWPEYGVDVRLGYSPRFRTWVVEGRSAVERGRVEPWGEL